MTFEEWKEWLKDEGACQPAINYLATQTSILVAIENCPESRWLGWLAGKVRYPWEYDEQLDILWKNRDEEIGLLRKERDETTLNLMGYEKKVSLVWNWAATRTAAIRKELLTEYYKAE